MKSKQIPLDRKEMTQEEILFMDVLKRFDYQDEKIIAFFSDFKDMTTAQIKEHEDPNAADYRNIANKMLPLDQ